MNGFGFSIWNGYFIFARMGGSVKLTISSQRKVAISPAYRYELLFLGKAEHAPMQADIPHSEAISLSSTSCHQVVAIR
jgi:hypothetical protein